MYKKTTFKNGLRVITVPQKTAQTVTVLILVGTGSKYETKKISGISHFLEHMTFKGTKKRPSIIKVAEEMDKIGGVYNAFTGQEYTGYFAKVESSQFELAFDWVSDIFSNSLLPDCEMQKEKGVIIEEINMIYDHPMSCIGHVLWPKLLYGDQPAGWDIAGTRESVSSITRDELFNYRKNQYIPKNTILCVAGKIEDKQVQKLTKRYFSKSSDTKIFLKPKVVERQTQPECLVQFKETDQIHLALGVRAYNIFHPKRYALDILGNLLGGMMSSRLFIKLREELGAAYYIRTEVDADPDTGCLVSAAGIDNSKIENVITEILKEYKKFSQIKVSNSELKKAKDNLKGKLAIALEPSDARASFFGAQELLEKRILTLKEMFKNIDKVSSNDVVKVSRDIFKPEKLNLAVIGPIKDKNKFKKILKF